MSRVTSPARKPVRAVARPLHRMARLSRDRALEAFLEDVLADRSRCWDHRELVVEPLVAFVGGRLRVADAEVGPGPRGRHAAERVVPVAGALALLGLASGLGGGDLLAADVGGRGSERGADRAEGRDVAERVLAADGHR